MPIIHQIDDAIRRGLEFLSANQLPDGSFRVLIALDDPTLSGQSLHVESGCNLDDFINNSKISRQCVADPSIFPTALIVQSLSRVEGSELIRDRAVPFLVSEQDRHGLWYHWTQSHPMRRMLPPDLDDTSCASQALIACGHRAPDNKGILLANRNRQGLFYTWIVLRPLWNTNMPHWRVTLPQLRYFPVLLGMFKRCMAKPFDIDMVVNANVLYYLGIRNETRAVADQLLDVLRKKGEADCDKWYDNPFVIWYFFARALSSGVPEAAQLIEARLNTAEPVTMQEVAMAALARLYFGRQLDPGLLEQLLARQLRSGAWPRSALYHGGRQRQPDGHYAPPNSNTPYWGSDELTTGFCLEALALWRKMLQK